MPIQAEIVVVSFDSAATIGQTCAASWVKIGASSSSSMRRLDLLQKDIMVEDLRKIIATQVDTTNIFSMLRCHSFVDH